MQVVDFNVNENTGTSNIL